MRAAWRVRWKLIAGALVLVTLLGLERTFRRGADAQEAGAPSYEVDPFWPDVPDGWSLGQVACVAVDSRDHVWIVQRPWSVANDELATNDEAECCRPAPPVMEFTPEGTYVQGWG